MESKAQIRWNLYRKSTAGRLEYQSINNLPIGTKVYGFKVRVTPFTRCSIVGNDIHEMEIVQFSSSSKAAFRLKKDKTYFKKHCNAFDYCMFTDKAAAERAQKNVARDLLEQLTEELSILDTLKKKAEELVK